MGKRITFSISGRGPETDAPTVADLVDQLRDYFDLLGIIEETLADDSQSAIQWRVVQASTNSPLSFTIEAFARQYAVNVDRRADVVVSHTLNGLHQLQVSAERPPHFPERALQKAERIFERVTNGLDQTQINADQPGFPSVDLTPSTARIAARNVRTVLQPSGKAYKEMGSIEGYVQSVDEDGRGRRIVQLKHRLTGDTVKCFVTGDAEKEFAQREIRDVWRHQRVSCFGTIHFKAPGLISYLDAYTVRFLRTRSELPDVDDIIDPNFTGGMRSEDYLEKLRNGDGDGA
jgi:hypothetical protein